ncbi:MAG: hypothetical protein ACLTTJ_09215 [Blautia sp.]
MKPGAEIIYMGWIMAGKIKGYPEAARKYRIQAVCGVGMGQTGTQLAEVRTKNKVPQRIPLLHCREPLISKTSWCLQNDDECHGKDRRKSIGG